MRIASLVPSSTEMLFELGLGDDIVAVTHECDYPPEAASLPHLTRSVIPEGLSAPEVDAAVREQTEQGKPLYLLDEERLQELDPELIVTQAVCEVCAVSYDDVVAVAQRLPSQPEVISLDPTTIGEVFADVPRLAKATDTEDEGEELVAEAAARMEAVQAAVEGAEPVTVAALEWLDPIFIGGHWVPQMIEMAGGVDVLGLAGEKSAVVEWDQVEAMSPDVVVSMPCGYETERAATETFEHAERLRALGARVAAVDASSYFSRPGPRIVDGIELLGHLLHPDRVREPSPGRFRWLELDRAAGPAAR